MTLGFDWFYLAVFSSITASVVTLLQKTALDKNSTDPIAFGIYYQFLVSIIGLPGAIINAEYFPFSTTIFILLILMASFTAIGNLLYYFALSSIELSQVAIISSTTSLWLLLGGFIFLDEKITGTKITGILLVLSGIFFIYFKKNSFNKFGFFQILVLISAAFSGLTGLFDKHLLTIFNVNTYQVLSYFLQAAVTTAIMPGALKKVLPLVKFNKTNLIIISSAALINFGAYCYFSALKSGGEISKINPILQASTILTILFGILFFNEKENLFKKFLGAITISAGILLIRNI